MKDRSALIIAVVASVVVTCILYDPARILIFKITEHSFANPLGNKQKAIRNDAFGEGEFGAKRSNGRSHAGIDILAPVGTPVFASKSGTAFCGNVPAGYGKYVMIYHPDGYVTLYGHLSAWALVSPQKVRRGDLIGFVGKTGNAQNREMQPHLHFEIKKEGEPLDPDKLLK